MASTICFSTNSANKFIRLFFFDRLIIQASITFVEFVIKLFVKQFLLGRIINCIAHTASRSCVHQLCRASKAKQMRAFEGHILLWLRAALIADHTLFTLWTTFLLIITAAANMMFLTERCINKIGFTVLAIFWGNGRVAYCTLHLWISLNTSFANWMLWAR